MVYYGYNGQEIEDAEMDNMRRDRPRIKYVELNGRSAVHLVGEGGKTKCGRNYRQYDFLPIAEDEFDENRHALCHKCSGTKREAPRTIREAFRPGYERSK